MLSENQPATQQMLKLVRTELKADIESFRSEVNSRFSRVDAQFNRVDARFSEVDSKLESVLQSVHHVATEVARLGVLTEEQNSRNRVVLEGLTGLASRQDRVEIRMDEVQKTAGSLARPAT